MRNCRVGHRAERMGQSVCRDQGRRTAREGLGRGRTGADDRREVSARARLHRGRRRAVQGLRRPSTIRPASPPTSARWPASRRPIRTTARRRSSARSRRFRPRRRPTRPTRSSCRQAPCSSGCSRRRPIIPGSRTTSSTPTTCRRSRRAPSTRRGATRRLRRPRRMRSTCRRTRSPASATGASRSRRTWPRPRRRNAKAPTAEELHALDYQAYAYLQMGQDEAVAKILAELPAIAARLSITDCRRRRGAGHRGRIRGIRHSGTVCARARRLGSARHVQPRHREHRAPGAGGHPFRARDRRGARRQSRRRSPPTSRSWPRCATS